MNRRFQQMAILPLFCLTLFSCNLFSPSSESQYKLTTFREGQCESIMEIDINRDGTDELLIDVGSQLDIMDATATRYHHSLTKVGAFGVGIYPLITGSLDSLAFLFNFRGKDSTRIELRTKSILSKDLEIAYRNFLVFKGEDRNGNGILDITAYPGRTIVNRFGREITPLFVETGKDSIKRGVIAIDMQTGKIAWQYLFGSTVEKLCY